MNYFNTENAVLCRAWDSDTQRITGACTRKQEFVPRHAMHMDAKVKWRKCVGLHPKPNCKARRRQELEDVFFNLLLLDRT